MTRSKISSYINRNAYFLIAVFIFLLPFFCNPAAAQETITYNTCYDLFEHIDRLTPLGKKYDKQRAKNRKNRIPLSICEDISKSDTLYIVLGKGVDYIVGSSTEFVMGCHSCYYSGLLDSDIELLNGENIAFYKKLVNRLNNGDYTPSVPDGNDNEFRYNIELFITLVRSDANEFTYSLFEVYEDNIDQKSLFAVKCNTQVCKSFFARSK